MGLAEDYLAIVEREKAQQAKTPAICRACKSTQDVRLYAEEIGDVWVSYQPVYKKSYRCLLCPYCVSTISPSVMSLIEKKNKKGLRDLPIKDKSGRYLPEITQYILSFKPNYFPDWSLGEKEVLAWCLGMTRVLDCVILDLFPKQGQDYWLDEQTKLHGNVMTSFYPSYAFPFSLVDIPCRIKFTRIFTNSGKEKVIIWRKQYNGLKSP